MKIISAVVSAVLCLLLLPTASAQAQATRTWISGVGDDVNPCSRTAPCKTFQGAISKTAKGGEINVLDSCGCGGVTITKSISIIAHEGVLAGVLVASTNAIIINITDPADAGVVNLHGLDIEGLGATGSPGINGIHIVNAKSVTIDKLRIRGFRGAGSDSSRHQHCPHFGQHQGDDYQHFADLQHARRLCAGEWRWLGRRFCWITSTSPAGPRASPL